MGELWTDLQLATVLFIFVYLVQWAIGTTGSRKIGIVLAIVIVWLTVYQHCEILIIVIVFFFGYAFFETFELVFAGRNV